MSSAFAKSKFLRLIEVIYDNVGSDDHWPAIANALSDFMGGGISEITFGNLSAHKIEGHYATSMLPPGVVTEYEQAYFRSDPRQGWLLRHQGRPFTCLEMVDDAHQFERTGLVDFLNRSDVQCRWALGELDSLSNELSVLVSVMRGQQRGPFDSRNKRMLSMVMPHIRNSLRLHSQLGRLEQSIFDFSHALDSVSEPVILAARTGRLVYANAAATAILANGKWLRVTHGILHCIDTRAQLALESALQSASSLREAIGLAEPRSFMAIGEAHRPSVISVTALPRRALSQTSSFAEVLIVVHDKSQRFDAAEIALRAIGFSKAEISLTQALAGGLSLEEHAIARGITIQTARTQLKSALSKADCHTQVQLVRLVLSYG